jgi:ActR/RegA family two-component response regulator
MVGIPHAQDLTVEEALGVAEVARILGVHRRTVNVAA